MNASAKRTAAVAAFSAKYFPEATGHKLIETLRSEIVSDIEAMRSLGRTERWQNCLSNWIDMVNDESNPIDWAALQGSIYAAYAAE